MKRSERILQLALKSKEESDEGKCYVKNSITLQKTHSKYNINLTSILRLGLETVVLLCGNKQSN